MQEEIEHRTVALVVSSAKMTGREFRAAIEKYLAHMRNKSHNKQASKDVTPHGKQTVKQLVGQDQGASSLELDDPDIKAFDRIARKIGVDYAIQRVKNEHPPKYLIFFKARDGDVINSALESYLSVKMSKGKSDLLDRLRKPVAPPTKLKDQVLER